MDDFDGGETMAAPPASKRASARAAPELRYEGAYLTPSGERAVDWLVENHRDAMPTAIYFAIT